MADRSDERLVARAHSWRQSKTGRLVWRIGSVVVLLLAGGVIALGGERLLGGGGGGAETRVTTFTDWRVVCPPVTPTTPNCALTLDVLRDTGGVLLTLSLLDPTIGSPLSITVPHGVALDSGMGFTIGAEPVRVRPYETCTNAGCIGLVTVDADTLKALSSNMAGMVVVAIPGNPQPVNVPFSLRGFADGYAGLQRAKSQRTSMFSFLGL